MKRSLGTCYYPEHWPEDIWADDARRMVELGLTWVRIGEFAWSRLEPEPERFELGWLDRAIETLGAAGLKVVLGTPTATPPRWMLDRHPDMLAVDIEGRPRRFGSRRHYCFSHRGYRAEAVRITEILARRYGKNPHIAAWQTDNEYGCHDTTLSYSDAARNAFRDWLAQRYKTVDALNAAWGNVFWSMEYARFDQIDLPNLTVTEANPAHWLAFRRFTSDQVVAFNRAQTEILRAHTDAPITHNYMGRITDFDHFRVGEDLDFASWDSYPLGFLEDRVGAPPEWQRRFARQGDPDFQAFHHDLYRAVGKGRWWVMEQQPGPVNWAPHNPAPAPGMVRLWSWEAFAHGAEAVCYFRWRQAPFAQEQMHSGLLLPDGEEGDVCTELRQVISEIAEAPDVAPAKAPVALIFDYDADAMWTIQPHGAGASYFGLVFDTFRALRRLGLSVNIVPPTGVLNSYKMVVIPGLMHISDRLGKNLAAFDGEIVLGPRAAVKTEDLSISVPLGPTISGINVTVAKAESLRSDMTVPLGSGGVIKHYREHLSGAAEILERDAAGAPVVMRSGRMRYLGGWFDDTALRRVFARACDDAGIETLDLPEGVRIRDTETERFWFNYETEAQMVEGRGLDGLCVLFV